MGLRTKLADMMLTEALTIDHCTEEMQERIVFVYGTLPEGAAEALAGRRAYFTQYRQRGGTLLKAFGELPRDEEPPEMDTALYVVWHGLAGNDNMSYLAIKSLDEAEADAAIYAILEGLEENEMTGTLPEETRLDKMRLIVGLASENASPMMRLQLARDVVVYGVEEGDIRAAQERVRDLLGHDLPQEAWNDALARIATDAYFARIEDWPDGTPFVKSVLQMGADDVLLRLVALQLLYWDDEEAREPLASLMTEIKD